MIQFISRPTFTVTDVSLTFSVAPTLTRTITYLGRKWLEYQISTSCTMTAKGMNPECLIWLCGGGGGSSAGSTADGTSGGGGGGSYCTQIQGVIESAEITIGAGGEAGRYAVVGYTGGTTGGTTSIAFPSRTVMAPGGGGGGSKANYNNYYGGSGGTGGGAGFFYDSGLFDFQGTGDGKIKTPFGDSTNFKILCAGGGGGGVYNNAAYYKGGDGGSDGSDGLPGYGTVNAGIANRGTGGVYGGGNGGSVSSNGVVRMPGSAGSAYGAGGGGGAAKTEGAAGYKGVVVIRIPI